MTQRNLESLGESEDRYAFISASGETLTCVGCGEKFERPLFATITVNGNVQKYYACPRCMTKVEGMKPKKSKDKELRSETHEDKPSTSRDSTLCCNHFLGYLKKRERDAPIPDECLTCGKMVECMLS